MPWELYNYFMRLNLARGMIGLVILWNLQAAVVFLLQPERYASAFRLQDPAGEAVLRGMGVLFAMWNIPYLVALWHPVRNRISLFEALAMQTIGLAGETLIFTTLSVNQGPLRDLIARFLAFDGMGLLLLLAALWITRRERV
jgi:hypothetical protein